MLDCVVAAFYCREYMSSGNSKRASGVLEHDG